MFFPKNIANEEELEQILSQPHPAVIEMMKRLDGDIMILGIAGKMGITLGRQAMEAIKAAGVVKKVYGVARFSEPGGAASLERYGIIPIKCNLLNREEVNLLPQVKNVIFMAGRKFGTEGSEAQTWAMNVLAPSYVGEHFKQSNIVVFSTGCVYPLVEPKNGGCNENVMAEPVGEYSQSCRGRERIFEYCSSNYGINVLLFRLNYAVDMRYGVLHDIAMNVWNEQVISRNVSHFNVIWQGDANAFALLALEHTSQPPTTLNITGAELISVEYIADAFGKAFGKTVKYEGTPSGRCYLSNAEKSFKLFGMPLAKLEWIIERQTEWIKSGGRALGKPTHFEVNNGKF